MKVYTAALLVFYFFCSFNASSQLIDSLHRIYLQQTIYQHGNKYVLNNKRITYHDLEKQFATPVTLRLYQKSRKKVFISRIFNVTSIALIITSVFIKTNVGGSIAFAAGTGSLGLAGIYYQTQANQLIQNAIWLHNQHLLFGDKQ